MRGETKPLEHRSALTPSTTKALIDAGYVVNVERSPVRIFDDKEFEDVGAKLVPEGSWPDAPEEHLIVGLKELPDEIDFPLRHTHIQFAHCYKQQAGWDRTLSRFKKGGGVLYDLEFLQDDSGRRVAAFGYHAGYSVRRYSALFHPLHHSCLSRIFFSQNGMTDAINFQGVHRLEDQVFVEQC